MTSAQGYLAKRPEASMTAPAGACTGQSRAAPGISAAPGVPVRHYHYTALMVLAARVDQLLQWTGERIS
jgi:hypothetical protein